MVLTIRSICDHILSFQQQTIIMNVLSLLDHFSITRNTRQQWKIEHKLAGILFLTVGTVIGDTDSYEGHKGFEH